MTLEEEIAEAQSCLSDPPKNESNTCEWVILPLLWAAGYARRDIQSRMADSTGQYPDYTLLPNDADKSFYLEAKAWNVLLEDIHAKQALNYANHNGKRFVVLTNGQIWRIYDNAIQGQLGDKLVVHASLHDTAQITDFMTMLSKTEVLSGSLERWAAEASERKTREALEQREIRQWQEEAQRIQERQRELRLLLETTLPEQLKNPNSDIVLILTSYLNEKEEYKDLAPETLSLWFTEFASQSPENTKEEPANTIPLQSVPPSFAGRQGQRTLTLKALQGLSIDGKNSRPVALHTPDGAQVAVRSWVDLAAETIRWLLQQSLPLPIPFESGNRNRWFLSASPVHKREELRRKFKPITANRKTVHMDSDQSGEGFLRNIYALCQKMQIPPEEFRVTIEG